MLLDRPREEIARDLAAEAERVWGPERAAAQRSQIEETAEWLALIGGFTLEFDGDEPDFLVASAHREGTEWR